MVGKFKIQIKKEGDKTCVKLQGAEMRKYSTQKKEEFGFGLYRLRPKVFILESNFKSNSF